MTTHLFKLLHGEHLLGELQYEILSHCAAEHLVNKSQRSTSHRLLSIPSTTHRCYVSPLLPPLIPNTHILNHLLGECFWQGDVLPEEQGGGDLEE